MIHSIEKRTDTDEPSIQHYAEFKKFQTDVLHLGYILDGLTIFSWLDLLIEIVNYVHKNNIKLILLDRTGEPRILDYQPTTNDISTLKIQEHLSRICETVIVTDDWTYFYKPQSHILFFPYNLWIQSTRNISKYYVYQDTVYDTTIDKTKPLMCLNRNLQWHRIYLLSLVYDAPWLPLVDFSFIRSIDEKMKTREGQAFFTYEEGAVIEKVSTPIYLDYENADCDIRVGYSNGASNVNTPVYARCAVNLITETSVDEGIVLTEKITKAILAYQIPILISNTGASQFLEDIGIDMFSDYVPWKTWYRYTNDKIRIQKIVRFVNKIMRHPDRILLTHRSFHQRLIKNKETFHSKDFARLITKQLDI
jgi:hypothetical protein|tara:strand:+ start:21 stop:1112 length:1092 start_codon:yes stop_codon:yes gene_type:complete